MRIRVENLTKTFGNVPALDRVSFEVPSGRVYGFVGPNGAGKTTALRIMAGLARPDSGDVFFDGISAVDFPERVPEFAGFMPDTLPDSGKISVREYLDFFARAFGLRGGRKRGVLERVSDETNLGEIADRDLRELSKGMKQRVSLARILISDPRVLLLDEPAAGLDPRARILLREILARQTRTGRTILLSSHILSELEELVSGVVILEKGRIVRAGDPAGWKADREKEENDGIRVLLAFPGAAEEFLEPLRNLPFVRSAEIHSPKQVLVVFREGAFAGNMAELFRSGLPISAMRRPEFGLESVFLNATKGEVQ